MTVETLQERFEFLEALRMSGAVNMFGARIHLEITFGDGPDLARAVHAEWMRTFSEETGASDRARAAFPRFQKEE